MKGDWREKASTQVKKGNPAVLIRCIGRLTWIDLKVSLGQNGGATLFLPSSRHRQGADCLVDGEWGEGDVPTREQTRLGYGEGARRRDGELDDDGVRPHDGGCSST